MRWAHHERVREVPLSWPRAWEGRITRPGSRWVTDGKMIVARSAVPASRREKLEREVCRTRRQVGVRKVDAMLAACFPADDEGEVATWVDDFEDRGVRYVQLGPVEWAVVQAPRLRLLHHLTGFDRLTFTRTRDGRGLPTPLRAWKDGELVGALMPVAHAKITFPTRKQEDDA